MHLTATVAAAGLSPLITAGAAIIAIAIAAAGGVGTKIYATLAKGYREERDLAQERADRLEREKLDLADQVALNTEKIHTLELELAELKSKDVTALFDLMKHHDERMVKASSETLVALERVSVALDRVGRAVIPTR